MTTVRAAHPKARRAAEESEAAHNWLYLDPVVSGRYPTEVLPPEKLPPAELVLDGDLETISAPVDFLGLNYYNPQTLSWRDPGDELRRGEQRRDDHSGIVEVIGDEVPLSASGWPIDPEGLYELLVTLHKRAPGLPIFITENGMAADDYVDPEGGVDDLERISYLHGHLEAAARAIADGVDLRGYFCWSLLDNFEWAEGYSKRFGLVFVDFGTQTRTPKASARYYSEVVRANALPAR